MNKEVILTGIRSNDEPTLGNYLGAFLPMAQLQKKYAGTHQLNMFVPDLHSITTPVKYDNLYENSIKNIKYFIASGLDIKNPDTLIYRQSYIAAHSELTWILDCFSYFGEISRMTEFKEKASNQANVSVGLLNYPILMAADILLYGAKWVPVGEDQRQHLELTRDLAIRLNNKFGELVIVPEDWNKQLEFSGQDAGVRIRSLRNPEKKMSKSVEDPAGTILLSGKPDEAAQKVMSATTDSLNRLKFDWENQPGVTNLLQILALLGGRSQSEVNSQWEGKASYGELKNAVAEAVKIFLTDFQAKLSELNQEQIIQKLEADEQAAKKIADATLLKIQKAVGLRAK